MLKMPRRGWDVLEIRDWQGGKFRSSSGYGNIAGWRGGFEAEHWSTSTLDAAVILLETVVQAAAGPPLAAAPSTADYVVIVARRVRK